MTIYYNSLPQIAIVTKSKTFFVHELEIKLQGILPRVTQPKNLAQIPAHKTRLQKMSITAGQEMLKET